MPNNLTFNFILCAAISLLIYSCKNDSGKVKMQEVTLQDIKQDEKDIKPPPPPAPPPRSPMPMISVKEKCFINNGLKYKTTITLFVGDTSFVLGNAKVEELETGEMNITEFIGNLIDNKLTVNFKKNPPVIGSSSEWTDSPWTIKKAGDKETLLIVFNAKNYETNKWENVAYEFNVCN